MSRGIRPAKIWAQTVTTVYSVRSPMPNSQNRWSNSRKAQHKGSHPHNFTPAVCRGHRRCSTQSVRWRPDNPTTPMPMNARLQIRWRIPFGSRQPLASTSSPTASAVSQVFGSIWPSVSTALNRACHSEGCRRQLVRWASTAVTRRCFRTSIRTSLRTIRSKTRSAAAAHLRRADPLCRSR